ncbi:unnamed protein product [Linum tenue]|uniref:Uncharacterized protein n=1 Tax=Linum tenue TaxID=586396 RepID=A0AAV0PBH9_9ROSI|nr:unnamed protein product [Linum tenue]
MNSNKVVVIGFGILLLAFLHAVVVPPSMAAVPLIPRSHLQEMAGGGSALPTVEPSGWGKKCHTVDTSCPSKFCCSCSIGSCGACCG